MKTLLGLATGALGILILFQAAPGEAGYVSSREPMIRTFAKETCRIEMERNHAELTCWQGDWKTHRSTIAMGFWTKRRVRFDEERAPRVVRLAQAYTRASQRCATAGSCRHVYRSLNELEREIEVVGRRYGWYSASQ